MNTESPQGDQNTQFVEMYYKISEYTGNVIFRKMYLYSHCVRYICLMVQQIYDIDETNSNNNDDDDDDNNNNCNAKRTSARRNGTS